MSSRKYRHSNILADLRNRIESGEWAEGAQLPSEAQLIDMYQASRHQVREALRALEIAGYLERFQGRGSFVAPQRPPANGLCFSGSSTVAIAIPHYKSHYMRQIVDGFLQRASESGLQAIACNLQFDNDSEYAFLQGIRDSGAVGLALWLSHCDERSEALLTALARNEFPVVFIDRYMPDLPIDYITSNNEQMAYELTSALIERGHSRIGMVVTSNDRNVTSVQERTKGFRRAMAESDLAVRPDWTIEIASLPFDEEDIHVIHRVMAHNKRPTAFFILHDQIGMPLYQELHALGFSSESGFDLASVDDDHFFEDNGIPILHKQQQGYAIGQRSAEMLVARVDNPGLPQQRVVLEAGPLLFDEDLAVNRAARQPQKGGKGLTVSSTSVQ